MSETFLVLSHKSVKLIWKKHGIKGQYFMFNGFFRFKKNVFIGFNEHEIAQNLVLSNIRLNERVYIFS